MSKQIERERSGKPLCCFAAPLSSDSEPVRGRREIIKRKTDREHERMKKEKEIF